MTVYVEAFTSDGYVPFDQLGEGGVVVGDGPGSLERQLSLTSMASGSCLKAYLTVRFAALRKAGLKRLSMASYSDG